MRVPWNARRLNQSILKDISPNYSFKTLMLKLKLITLASWCKELTHWKRPRSWERLDVGEGDDTGWDGWMASLTQWTWAWVGSRSWWWTGKPSMQQSMGHRVRHDWTTELNWTEAYNSLRTFIWTHYRILICFITLWISNTNY